MRVKLIIVTLFFSMLSIICWSAGASTRAGQIESATKPGKMMRIGDWGGRHIAMRITETGGTYELDCGRGTIDQPLMGRNRTFEVRGIFVREHGGPIREGEIPDSHPARYQIISKGKHMTFTITLIDTGETVGPFQLFYGEQPLIVKCL